MIDKNTIDPNALHYYRMLKEAGFSAYFVGGSVRDLLLGKRPKDFDIATNATPQQIKRVIPQGRIIGRRFRHVMLERDGGRYEIVTFRGPILPAENEVAEETEENTQEDGRESAEPQEQERRFPDLNQFGNAQQDAVRRDFTINALFYDPDADELVDYVEGKLDIDQKVIRTIGDAKVRMEEDPIRILRAIRHKTKLGLEYDPYLIEAIQEKAPLLEQTSKDRIREEFLKVCNDRSLGSFLTEAKKLQIQHHVAPWFDDVDPAAWEQAVALWQKFADSSFQERPSPDMGLTLMMTPLLEALVIAPYKLTLPEAEKHYLPDMKYFLSCETLRNYFLRNLRISRAQTDYIVRALFYWSRMTGLWVESDPPRRVVGRLFQHQPALLAAKLARLQLDMQGKALPQWLADLAEYDTKQRQPQRPEQDRRPQRQREHRSEERAPNADGETNDTEEVRDQDTEEQRPSANYRLPPPDEPMVWNGPLHAPVLRPSFTTESPNRWARKNQTVYAYRPSGIPNQPTDYAMLKSQLVSNYKPELETPSRSEESGENRQGRNRHQGQDRKPRDRGDRGDRGDHRGQRGGRRPQEPREPRTNEFAPPREAATPSDEQPIVHSRAPRREHDEDSIGNIRLPGENPSYSMGHPMEEIEPIIHEAIEEEGDNIGNRLDAPPTSGHVGINGEGVLGHRGGAGGPGKRPGQNHQGGGGHNNQSRRRRGGRRHGGGSGRGGSGGGGGSKNFRGGGGGAPGSLP